MSGAYTTLIQVVGKADHEALMNHIANDIFFKEKRKNHAISVIVSDDPIGVLQFQKKQAEEIRMQTELELRDVAMEGTEVVPKPIKVEPTLQDASGEGNERQQAPEEPEQQQPQEPEPEAQKPRKTKKRVYDGPSRKSDRQRTPRTPRYGDN